jgi:tetratricopeptide (TPR) repeat protein
LKLGDYVEGKKACNFALAFDAKCEKAFFRRGQCQLASRNFNEAIEDFQTVLQINPLNVAAEEQIQQCHQAIKEYEIKEKEYYRSRINKKKTNDTQNVRKTFHQNQKK